MKMTKQPKQSLARTVSPAAAHGLGVAGRGCIRRGEGRWPCRGGQRDPLNEPRHGIASLHGEAGACRAARHGRGLLATGRQGDRPARRLATRLSDYRIKRGAPEAARGGRGARARRRRPPSQVPRRRCPQRRSTSRTAPGAEKHRGVGCAVPLRGGAPHAVGALPGRCPGVASLLVLLFVLLLDADDRSSLVVELRLRRETAPGGPVGEREGHARLVLGRSSRGLVEEARTL